MNDKNFLDIHNQIPDSKIGIIAGNGDFPLEFVKNANKENIKVVALCIKGEVKEEMKELAYKCYEIKVGEVGKALKILKKEEIHQLVFAGGVKRINLFGNLKIDAKGLIILAKAKTIRDDVLLRAIANELEGIGIKVLSPTILLNQSVAKEGLISNRDLTKEEEENIKFGWNVAKAIGSYDIGQGVVVADGLIVAVEAVEGTDEMILRAGNLIKKSSKKPKGVLVKLVKPQQDLRIDLPTVGPKTLENMKNAGLTALAIEAGKTVIMNPVEFQKKANEYNIAVKVFNGENKEI